MKKDKKEIEYVNCPTWINVVSWIVVFGVLGVSWYYLIKLILSFL